MSDGGGFGFEIGRRDPDSRARTGRLTTPHGSIETPNFIFCGTKAAIKGVTPGQMREAGTGIILANTYHLMIQPGAERIAKLGGLHAFMGWDGPMLTDSGGFQIFSMGHGGVADEIKGRRNRDAAANGKAARPPALTRITEEGAEFRSYLDGSKLFLTPESSIEIQRKLGADLIVQLDECTPFHVERDYTARSMAMSHRWGDRSLAEFARGDDGAQALYGVIQGGVYPDLRRESTEYTAGRPFFGTAVGGSLGAHKDQMYEVVSYCAPHIHPDRPVHLLGIGGFADIFAGVRLGIDTFDCVHPTRVARHGWALMKGAGNERINLRNTRFRDDAGPIDESCGCATCATYSRAYLNHLVRAGEVLSATLLSIHNVATMNRLMAEVRAAIGSCTLDAAEKEWLAV
ncbi:MAG: tRNA guanosine(34) transglycosylase Tgt [Inquilinus sp.]|nr:tRNA guanosine(34) transglycosylase Tgt [Inquilinus sp.]